MGFSDTFVQVTISPLEVTHVWRSGDCHGGKYVGWVLAVIAFVLLASCMAFARSSIVCRRWMDWREDSWSGVGIFSCNDVVALSSAATAVSAGVAGGFVIYLCLKKLLLTPVVP